MPAPSENLSAGQPTLKLRRDLHIISDQEYSRAAAAIPRVFGDDPFLRGQLLLENLVLFGDPNSPPAEKQLGDYGRQCLAILERLPNSGLFMDIAVRSADEWMSSIDPDHWMAKQGWDHFFARTLEMSVGHVVEGIADAKLWRPRDLRQDLPKFSLFKIIGATLALLEKGDLPEDHLSVKLLASYIPLIPPEEAQRLVLADLRPLVYPDSGSVTQLNISYHQQDDGPPTIPSLPHL